MPDDGHIGVDNVFEQVFWDDGNIIEKIEGYYISEGLKATFGVHTAKVVIKVSFIS